MPDIYVLPLWDYKQRALELSRAGKNFITIDTTSGSGDFNGLSPFIIGPCNTYLPGVLARNFENLWQYSKVYNEHIYRGDSDWGYGGPSKEWEEWRNKGWANPRAVRYPMGKGRKPEYLYWNGKQLDYVTARKQVYALYYFSNVIKTIAYTRLKSYYDAGTNLILLDYDAYDHQKLGLTLHDVINNPDKKCGHAFILAMILTGVLPDCIEF